ncbi:uncharacterized protein BDW47DRAFT_119356 [Aspergillus candidus]|uniref:C2H2-type domain-containing protein n=1 Tax=Aspergillus candidus TaxID=41067 RepID=A0A2I2F503_ASPCN|nr:hypothetical protein BDW47DRAFT_119356 [Aspergillus candidus]PLB35721.1 hypothetical protein BDW47DRAFT_119356 [Aspergillus candidus]
MFGCGIYGEEYYDLENTDDHIKYYNHWYKCQTCDRHSRNNRAGIQHMNAVDHWAPTYDCETRPKEFRSWHAACQHMSSTNYWRPKETFNNENHLKMHLKSKIHRGSSLSCLFCNTSYTTATGMAHHLETESCSRVPRMNRETIHRMIREQDQNGFITVQQFEWHESECYLCHRWFRALSGLNQHLNSPVHKQKAYHCPDRRDRCIKDFIQQVHGVFQGGNLLAF